MIIKNILIGEDIRQEIGNKLSLMGIVGSSIDIDIRNKPKEMPAAVSFACLISIENTNSENDPKDFKVLVSLSIGETKLGDMTARIESSGMERFFHIPVPRFQVVVTESARLSVHVSIKKNDILVTEAATTLNINLKKN